jgi:hypothetical protein
MSLAAIVSVALLPGCGEKKPPPKPAAPPPQAAAPKPVVRQTDVATLLQTAHADKRVQFPSEKAPADEKVALSIIDFASAFAKGDSKALSAMLTGEAKDVLQQLTGTGQWEESTAKIEAVRVVEVSAPGLNPQSFTFALAVQEPGIAYPVRFNASLVDGKYLFNGQSGGRLTHPRANQFDDGKLDP